MRHSGDDPGAHRRESDDGTEWIRAPVPEEAGKLSREGVGPRLAALLSRRGVRNLDEVEAFLRPDLEALHPPEALTDLEEGLILLQRARTGERPVFVLGDYDVDGVSAAAILTGALRYGGVQVETVIPHRIREGYGLRPSHVERAIRAGADSLVTVDCGTNAGAALEAAHEAGLPVLVIDHHLPAGPTPPPSTVIVNPKREACDYPFRDLCAAGLALKVAQAFGRRTGRVIPLEALLRIACLGTIADRVPLRGENRIIASRGLESLARTRSRGLRTLFGSAGLRQPFQADDVGFRIGPRLNAAGRMGSGELALELLLTRDPGRATGIVEHLEELNQRRKREESRVVREATEILPTREEGRPSILVGWSEGWHRGVVGVAASRLARKFHRPTVLFAVEDDEATGSGRSVPGIHLHRFLLPWRDEYLRFGGHAGAVGLTVPSKDLEGLSSAWKDAAEAWDQARLAPRREYELELPPGDCDLDLWEELETLEPHGEGNPRPLLRVGPLRLAGEPRSFGSGHLRGEARGPAGHRVRFLGWRWAERIERLTGTFEVLAHLRRDRLYGTLELHLVEARSLE
ncbi:MAG: single-stranded-DNA-specific exonuclease RecJ [Thermoanaerobaculia bacterium]|nr:single-stranded-DNA-specific exonuclease RecJ [Thermoanaerobaculia bacterium]